MSVASYTAMRKQVTDAAKEMAAKVHAGQFEDYTVSMRLRTRICEIPYSSYALVALHTAGMKAYNKRLRELQA